MRCRKDCASSQPQISALVAIDGDNLNDQPCEQTMGDHGPGNHNRGRSLLATLSGAYPGSTRFGTGGQTSANAAFCASVVDGVSVPAQTKTLLSQWCATPRQVLPNALSVLSKPSLAQHGAFGRDVHP